jgi:4-amino-4-deoxy-L-arabinose transferase-like glycosyltransferase
VSTGRGRSLRRAVRPVLTSAPAAPVALICGWSVLVVLANPSGAFPLNDDWSYSRAVETLVDHGHLSFTVWQSMPLIAQVFWGALFTLPFGFSFLALRVSTAALGALGIVATYFLLRELRASQRIALLGASTLALNPLYFSLSLTFMTDVPFCALSTLSMLFFLRALRTDSRLDVFVGFAAAAGAILIRQPAVIVPVAFALTYILRHRLGGRSFVYAILPAGLEVLMLFSYPVILRHTIGLPVFYISATSLYRGILGAANRDWEHVVRTIGDRLLVETMYLGAFLLPLSIATTRLSLRAVSGRMNWKRVSGPLVIAAGLGGVVLTQGRLMPLSGNVFFDFGLGPPLLRDTYLLNLPHFPTAPQSFWFILTVASVIGGVVLISRLSTAVWRVSAAGKSGGRTLRAQIVFVLVVCTAYLVSTAVATSSPEFSFFDRYVLFAIPPLMLVLVYGAPILRAPRPAAAFAGVAVALGYGVFAVGATHDNLAWNRARWHAVDDLSGRGISYRDIDGGFEVNAWYRYDPSHPLESVNSFWVRESDYVVSFGPLNGYAVMRQYPYRRWMPLGRAKIVVSRRVRGEPRAADVAAVDRRKCRIGNRGAREARHRRFLPLAALRCARDRP